MRRDYREGLGRHGRQIEHWGTFGDEGRDGSHVNLRGWLGSTGVKRWQRPCVHGEALQDWRVIWWTANCDNGHKRQHAMRHRMHDHKKRQKRLYPVTRCRRVQRFCFFHWQVNCAKGCVANESLNWPICVTPLMAPRELQSPLHNLWACEGTAGALGGQST